MRSSKTEVTTPGMFEDAPRVTSARRGAAWLGVLAVASTAACSSGKATSSTSSSSSAAAKSPSASASAAAPPPPKGVKVTFDGKEVMFDNAWVYQANGPVIRLANKPFDCKGSLPKGTVTLDFSLTPGPGGKHFATGKPVAVRPNYSQQETDQKIPVDSWENGAQATIQPFEGKAGEIVKGTLNIDYSGEADGKKFTYKGFGGFEAKACEATDDSGHFPAQETAPDSPVAGTIDGKPFKGQTFLVDVASMTDYEWVANIYVVDGEASCKDKYDLSSGKKPSLMFRPLGANSHEKLTGSPQHADVTVGRGGKTESNSWSNEAWVQIDELSFAADATVKGKLAVTSKKVPQGGKDFVDVNAAGSFTAKVCR